METQTYKTPNPKEDSVESLLQFMNAIRIQVQNNESVPLDVVRHAILCARAIRERRALASRSEPAKRAAKASPISFEDL